MLEKAFSLSVSSADGLAIWSMEVMPASFIFLAVAGPIPLTKVRSLLSAAFATFAAGAFFTAGFLAAAFLGAAFLAAGALALLSFLGAVLFAGAFLSCFLL